MTGQAELRLTLDDGRDRRDVVAVVHRDDATLADLGVSAGWGPGGLTIDGVARPADVGLREAGVHDGSVVAPVGGQPGGVTAGAPGASLSAGGPAMAVTGGVVAGPTLGIPAGGSVIGRAPDAMVVDHPTVSHAHAHIRVDGGRLVVRDLGSTNGTWQGATPLVDVTALENGEAVRVGAVRLRFAGEQPDDGAAALQGGGGTTPFLRPPRAALPEAPDLIPAPTAASAGPAGGTPLSITAMVAPAVFALAMVVVLGSWRFAMFALLSPFMVLGSWFESRRRQRVAARGGDRRLKAALGEFRTRLEAAGARERTRLAALAPDPAEALRRAERPSTRLWERRPGDADHLVLHLGVGRVVWDPPVDGGRPAPAARTALEAARLLEDCTVAAALAQGAVAVVGERGAAMTVARSLLCQAATHHGPADLAVAIITSETGSSEWDWAKWLPHARRPDGRLGLALEPDAEAAVTTDTPSLLVLADGPAGSSGLAAVGRALRERQGVVAVVVADDVRSAPAWCRTVVELTDPDGSAVLHRPQAGMPPTPFLVAGVQHDVAVRWARALARFSDPESHDDRALPDVQPLDALAGGIDARALAAAWSTARKPDELTVGVGEHAAATFDLERAGGFAVVVGAAGSGKSTLLRTIVAAGATAAGPDRLVVALWAAGGGQPFGPLAGLPHVAASVRGAGAGDTLLDALRDELHRRAGGSAASRLLVLVDDADAVAGAADATLDELADIAARGAGLEVTVVVAARRWTGPVARAAWAVPGPRVALRMMAAADALALVGSADPASFDQSVPGRAAITHDGHRVLVQTAVAGGDRRDASGAVELLPFAFGAGPPPRGGRPLATAEHGALTALVEAARATGAADAAPLLAGDRAAAGAVEALRLGDLLNEDPGAVDGERRWSARPAERTLVASLGTLADGTRMDLDLREAAHGGHGPHGVLVGATGSGKSELLRVLLAGLVADHAPDELALVLVDFKGGATFAPFAGLPHVAGMITNLADDRAMIERMQSALEGEVGRRQELLHRAGDVGSLHAYHAARVGDPELEPLPSLLLVVDEFAELLVTRPEFLDLLATIGRVGRSLGIHLLLASQRLEEGRIRGLESHLRYRIALRTFNAADSRAILGSADASRLPSAPGVGFVKLDDEVVRVQAGYVSAPAGTDGRTELDVLVARLVDAAPRVHQVWLPPLPAAIPLDGLVGGLVHDPARGLVPPHWPGVGRLQVPLGVVDRPQEQAQTVHALDLAGASGNVAVVGAPQTGKSTTLRTLVCGLALTHSPTEVQVYAVDFGGGGLEALADLPHVGAVAGRRDPELVRRIVRHVQGVMTWRERRFSELGIDGMATLRARRAGGEEPGEAYGDVFLVLDGWASLRADLPDLEPAITDIATRGLGCGVHVLLSANRWMDVRSGLRDGFGAALELRLSDPVESTVGRRAADGVPRDRPGRGLVPDGHHVQVALPRIDGLARAEDAVHGLRDLVERVTTGWSGPPAPPVRLLPDKVLFTDLPGPDVAGPGGGRAALPLGIGEVDLGPVWVDVTGADPHLLVFGDGGSGKTSVLATLLTGLVTRCSPEQARVVVVDYRRTLLEVVPESHVLAYAGAAPSAAEAVGRFRDTLLQRVPGSDVTATQLRTRSWWTGPELYLVVDDYDLVVNPSGNPLAPLTELLAQGRDLGFHVLLARRATGTTRAFEPFLQRLRELGTPGVLLSGDPREGPLLGDVRPEAHPPGRGLHVTRGGGAVLVQTAWVPP